MGLFQTYTPPTPVSGFDPRGRRARKRPWVRFELADPKRLKVMIVVGKQVKVGDVTDPDELAAFLKKVQTAKDGRLVGIFCPAGVLTTPGMRVAKKDPQTGEPVLNAAGEQLYHEVREQRTYVPAAVIPQRKALGDSGEQNMAWVHDGQVHRLLLPFDSLKNVEAIDLVKNRDDVPEHRRVTQNQNHA